MTDRVALLRTAWGVLVGYPSAQASGLRAYELEEAPRLIRAVLNPAGQRGLLIEVGSRERIAVPRQLQIRYAAALVGEVPVMNVPGLGQRRFLYVWCRDQAADQAFEAFCAMLWAAVSNDEVSTALVRCSDEFRRLLLTAQEVESTSTVGLVGELVVLRRLVEIDPELISAWVGPSGARHDFRNGKSALEVKTTLRSEAKGRTVHISDIDQLDAPEGGNLHLYLVRLERAMGGSLSVASLVDGIKSRLNSDQVQLFHACLGHADSERWAASFEIREQIAYRVEEGFPRLSTSMLVGRELPAGVGRISYSVSLEVADEFQVPIQSAVDALAGGVV